MNMTLYAVVMEVAVGDVLTIGVPVYSTIRYVPYCSENNMLICRATILEGVENLSQKRT